MRYLAVIRHSLVVFFLAIQLLAPAAVSALTYETWDSAGEQNHNWKFWGGTNPGTDLQWLASGGIGDSGYVVSDLSNLITAPILSATAYWPAYAVPSDWDFFASGKRDVSQDINIADAAGVRFYARDLDGIDLGGGSLHFYIGDLQNGRSFYYHQTPIALNAGNWNLETYISFVSSADWIDFKTTNGPSSQSVEQIFDNPEYGLVIVNGNGAPSGRLGLDSFRFVADYVAVPEPGSILLLSIALLSLGLVSCKRA